MKAKIYASLGWRTYASGTGSNSWQMGSGITKASKSDTRGNETYNWPCRRHIAATEIMPHDRTVPPHAVLCCSGPCAFFLHTDCSVWLNLLGSFKHCQNEHRSHVDVSFMPIPF